MRVSSFKRLMGRRPRRRRPFALPLIPKHEPLPRAALPHYWHPDRAGVEMCSDDFAEQLRDIYPDLRACRPPAGAPIRQRRWAVWVRKPAVTHALCPGWLLLFQWPPEPYRPIPLDNRVFANLYQISAKRFGNAQRYWEACERERQKLKDSKQKRFMGETMDRAKDHHKSLQISSAGKGNRFALHHDGTLLPGKGTRNWLKETERTRLPGEVLRDKERQRDEARNK